MRGNIYSRESEKALLQEILDSQKAEFLAIYGRRRVGKTFLIREFFSYREEVLLFKSVGLQKGALSLQLENFMRQVSETFYGGAILAPPKNWGEAFRLLTKAIETCPKTKIILFLDELPWMDTKNSKLLQHLDYYWNLHWSNNPKVKLVICGSSASWIIKKIIRHRGGLHNRITREIHLSPFNLKETEEFLEKSGILLNHEQVALLYMAVGGIPYYLSYVKPGLSAPQIIESLAFSKNSVLLGEFDKLFSSLFENDQACVEILRHIAETREGIGQGELLKKLDPSLQGGSGMDLLDALEDADFIMSFKPHFHKRKGRYYRLVDEYTLFYFTWIEPVKETLQEQDLGQGNWTQLQNTPQWNTWSGYAFEALCYKHLAAIRKKLKLPPTAIANSWRYVPKKHTPAHGAQIDLLFDRMDHSITLCEIKYCQEPFVLSKSYLENLHRKMKIFMEQTRTKKQLFMTLIAANGLKNNFYAEGLIQGVVALDDLFV